MAHLALLKAPSLCGRKPKKKHPPRLGISVALITALYVTWMRPFLFTRNAGLDIEDYTTHTYI